MKYALKHLQSLVAVALCVILSCAFASCSDNDDEPDNSSLSGTTWTILSDIDSDGEADNEIVGTTMTFQKDGNVKFTPATDWTYAKWEQKKNTLKITLGEGEPDDYMEGSFTINGNKATYKYAWYDCDGKWGGENVSTMTLQKK